jgi:hypothetical protein
MLMEQLLRIMTVTLVITVGLLGAREILKICITIYLFSDDREAKSGIYCP